MKNIFIIKIQAKRQILLRADGYSVAPTRAGLSDETLKIKKFLHFLGIISQMAKYIIEGGNKLKGKISISGNKNSILPCLAACLLTEEEVILRNVPNISDIGVFSDLLRYLGAEIEEGDHLMKVKCKNIKASILPEDLVTKVRASVLLVGPILARTNKIEFSHPGGDIIGKRSIDAHIVGFKSLGYRFNINNRKYKGSLAGGKKQNCQVFLNEASVTATENLVMASVLGNAETILKNCAEEPHIVDLCNLLVQMGAKIDGIGTSTITISGVNKLAGTDFTIRSDHIEFGTYAIAAAITGGEIEIDKSLLPDLEPINFPLKEMGIVFKENENSITVSADKLISKDILRINIWPGFPTDLMSVAIVLATQARGATLCHDWMYESRMFFVDKLISMGANITIADPHRVLVYGPAKLYGRNLESPDIRAGMALVLAALTAKGQSIINKIEHIERGYEDVVGKLSSLGANIQRVD